MKNNSSWKPFVLGLSLAVAYVVGCATARVAPTPMAVAQAPVGMSRWEYFCTDGYNADTIMQRANQAGAEGWEMVGGVGSTRVPGLWCFKRPR